MVIEEKDGYKSVKLFWDDLNAAAKKKYIKAFGENGNCDVYPMAEFIIDDEKEDSLCIQEQ